MKQFGSGRRFLVLGVFCLAIGLLLSAVEGKRIRSRYVESMNRGIRIRDIEDDLLDPLTQKRIVRDVGDDEETESEEEERTLLEEEYDEEERKNREKPKPPVPVPVPTVSKNTTGPSPPHPNIVVKGSNGTTNVPQRPQRPPPPPEPSAKQGELYLPEGYNNLEIPKLNLGKAFGINLFRPLPCLVFVDIRSIRGFDELKGEITIELDLVVEWIDGILFDITKVNPKKAPTQKVLNLRFLRKIWHPDIYMDNFISKSQPSLIQKPVSLKFSPETGFISYTTRMALTLNCDMFFQHYPADTQRCEFQLRSFSHYSSDLDLSWFQHGVFLNDPYEPNFDIQVESVEQMKTVHTFNNPRNESHDTLQFTILARRKLSFHLVQTYLPSIFFIIITWLCYLIPAKFVEARIGISMTTLLTLTSMFASVRESTPIVSYVKAIDIWMVACIFFVFLTLLEFSFYVWVKVEEEEKETHSLKNEFETSAQKRERRRSVGGDSKGSTRVYAGWQEFVEKHGFLIFLLIFILFNVIYWSWLLTASDYFGWTVNATYTSIDNQD